MPSKGSGGRKAPSFQPFGEEDLLFQHFRLRARECAMSNGLKFNLAPFCGAHERFTWHAQAPEGLEHEAIAAALVGAGYKVRMDNPTMRLLDSPAGALVTLRAGHPVQVRVAMGLALEEREPAIHQEEARLNAILGFTLAPAPEATRAGLSETFQTLIEDRIQVIQDLYLNETMPIVVGYSGGKDSTAVGQLVWEALRRLPAEMRTKTVHLVSTDTGVENPAVARMADASLEAMNAAAKAQGIPWEAHRLRPAVEDSFWTMVLGRGYAVPRPLFRWCTERLKISPANAFIMECLEQAGGVVQVLGTRKTESASRARTMAAHEAGRTRPFMSPNGSLNLVDRRRKQTEEAQPKAWIFSPIEDWTTEDVWTYITQVENPWGYDNANISAMYASASDASECPMTLDASQSNAPSCGKSRFGCWTCTMVQEEKSLTSFIVNDPAAYGWLQPLLDLRNRLNPREEGQDEYWSDAPFRTHYRVQEDRFYLFHDKGKLVRGRYIQAFREDVLRDLLRAQARIQAEGPEWVRSFELISLEELEAIRSLWISVWNEVEDNLPAIYEEALGRPYPGPARKPLFRNVRPLVEALRAAAETEAQALGQDGRMLFEQAREVLVMEALRAKAEAVGERPLSTDEIYHRHQVHHEGEAESVARREQARRASIKRILAQAKAAVGEKEAPLALQVFDVQLDLGGINVGMEDVVAATPQEAVEVVARGWMAKYSDHAAAWGLTEAEILAGGTASWKRLANSKKDAPTALGLELGWWSVRFDRMGYAFRLLVKATHAREAIAKASQEALEHADVLARDLGVDEELLTLLVAEDEDDAPLARPVTIPDAQAEPQTLRARALEARGAITQMALGQHPALFNLKDSAKGTTRFLQDWIQEVG